MTNLEAIFCSKVLFFSFTCPSHPAASSRRSVRIYSSKFRLPWHPNASSWLDSLNSTTDQLLSPLSRRRSLVTSLKGGRENSPYETLELEGDADEEKIRIAYRRLAKYYHPDVYDGKGSLNEGETAEARFIKIQAAYELLMDDNKRKQYDVDNQLNPAKASEVWMEWLMKRRKAFDERGDMGVMAWSEQRQLRLNVRARQISTSKNDPAGERRILEREKRALKEYAEGVLKRHSLVLKKRELMRKKAGEEEIRELAIKLLAEEGFEIDTDDEDA